MLPRRTREQYFVSYRILFQSFLIGNTQLLAAFCAAAGKDLTAICSFHTLTKAMYSLTTFTMRLKSPFHVFNFSRLQNRTGRSRLDRSPGATIPHGFS